MKFVAAAAAAASLTAVSAAPASAAAATPSAPASLIVGLRSDDAAGRTVKALDADPDVRVLSSRATASLDNVTVTVPAGDQGDAVAALRTNPDVTYVEPNATFTATAVTPDDPMYAQQWGLTKAQVPAAWNTTTGASSTVVAVLDTGVTPVSELAGRVLPGYDFINNDNAPDDDHGHGTMAAGVIAAAGDNATGMAGVCWSCRILPVKVLGANGSGSTDTIARGIIWAADNGADVINMSLGGPSDSQAMRDAVAYAVSRDVVVVASAGNDGSTTRAYPAAITGAISVAGSTETDTRYSWSNYGTVADPWVDLAAPGLNMAPNKAGSYSWFQGTSSAGPVVAGVAALARSANPSATAAQVRAALESQADNVGTWVAKGRVDAAGTIQAIANPSSVPPAPLVDTTSPVVSAIVMSPATPARGTVTISPAVSDDVAVKKVTVTVAGRTITDTAAPWTLTWNTTGVNGSYPVTVTAYDGSGNTGTATGTVGVDNTGPSTEVTLTSTVSGTIPITLTRPSADTAKMELIVTGKLIGTATSSPWTIDWNTAGSRGATSVVVRTTDTAGNVSSATRTVVVDNSGPTLAFSSPVAGATLRGTVIVTATATDPSGVSKVELLAGDTVLAEDTTAPYSLSLDTTALNGSTPLVLRATDKLGQTSTVTRTVMIDNTAPTITGLGLDPSATLRGSVKIVPVVADDLAVRQVRLTVPTAKGGTATLTTAARPWTLNWSTTGLTGTFPIVATVLDAAGNTATYTEMVTLDNTLPSTAVGLTGTISKIVPITLTDPSADTATMQVVVGGKVIGSATAAPWTVTWDTTKQIQGSYAVTIRTTDTAGNVSTGTARVIVDNSGPSVVWSAPAMTSTPLHGTVTVTASASDVSGVAQVELLAGDTVIGTDTTAPYAFTLDTTTLTGSMPLTVRATDKLGLVNGAIRTFVIDNEAPTITSLGFDPAAVTFSGTARFRPVVADNVAIKQIRVTVPTAKGGTSVIYAGASPFTLNWVTTGLNGTYPVTATVYDTAGNTATFSASVTVRN